jgi:hypothetical protein
MIHHATIMRGENAVGTSGRGFRADQPDDYQLSPDESNWLKERNRLVLRAKGLAEKDIDRILEQQAPIA